MNIAYSDVANDNKYLKENGAQNDEGKRKKEKLKDPKKLRKRKRNKGRVLAAEERKMDPKIQPEGGKPEPLELPNALASTNMNSGRYS